MAGVQLVARGVQIVYVNERPTLHITRPELKMPREFGGLAAQIWVPTSIDLGGVKFGTGEDQAAHDPHFQRLCVGTERIADFGCQWF